MSHNNEDKAFYAAFEARYRGPRELIAARLEVYRPFIEPLAHLYPTPRALDLGCGRGEWLELLNRIGYQGVGVDLDQHMLKPCRELKLEVHHHDAIDFLRLQKSSSYAVISAFHVVEHIQFSALQELVEQALRVLQPGGLLIMETPNPENLIVSAVNFYLDPTHQKPIPPELLAFLPDYYGFESVKILRLQHDLELAEGKEPTLLQVLGGVSPDYAVVARKQGPKRYLMATKQAFELEVGVTLEALAKSFEEKVRGHHELLNELKKQVINERCERMHETSRIRAVERRCQELENWLKQISKETGHNFVVQDREPLLRKLKPKLLMENLKRLLKIG